MHECDMDTCFRYLLFFCIALFWYTCAARNIYGTTTVVGPAFVNREVTIKATPFYPWGCDLEWRYITDGGSQYQTINDANYTVYSEDGSFFLKWKATIKYNMSDFYAVCLTNTTIRTRLTTLNMKDIVGRCGALVVLSPVVRGADVELGYFPSDYSLQSENKNSIRTWKKNTYTIQLRKDSYKEETVSEFLYILTIFDFQERDEGTYNMKCNSYSSTDSVQIHISEPPSYPVLGPKNPDFNTTECIYVDQGLYCTTENGTKPVQVTILIGDDSFILAESKMYKGLYRFRNVHQQMDGMSRRGVTCQVSNAALKTPYEVHGIICEEATGNPPVLEISKSIDGKNLTATCEVRNALPAPTIEMHVDKVLLGNVQQTDLFDRSSYTFTSTSTVTTASNMWNGKQICCTMKRKDYLYDFMDLKDFSICKDINLKYPPSELLMSVQKIHEHNVNVCVSFLNITCETNDSNPPCIIEWSSDNENLRYAHNNNWTNGKNQRYRSVSSVFYNLNEYMAGGTITCSTKCDNFTSHLIQNYTVSVSDFSSDQCMKAEIVEKSNQNVLNLTCKTVDTFLPCTFDWSSNSVFLSPISTAQWTNASNFGYTSVSYALYFISQGLDGKRIQCSADCVNDSSYSEQKTYILSFDVFREPTNNPAQGETQQWYMSVLYAVAGTILVLLVTRCTMHLSKRCKSHVYETPLRRRIPASTDQRIHVYAPVQKNVETAILHNMRDVSAMAMENKNTPPLLNKGDNEVRLHDYDYADTPSDHETSSAANYIHAI